MYVYLLLLFLVCITILFTLVLLSLLWTTIVGRVPYLPTPQERVKKVIQFANIKKGEKAVDLGSGDGRIVIALAQAGAEAHGYELNVFYVLFSRWKIRRLHLEKKAFIHWRNFFHVDLDDYDIVTFFAISYVLKDLERKLRNEIKKTTRVISISYKLKTWPIEKKEDFVFLYKKLF